MDEQVDTEMAGALGACLRTANTLLAGSEADLLGVHV